MMKWQSLSSRTCDCNKDSMDDNACDSVSSAEKGLAVKKLEKLSTTKTNEKNERKWHFPIRLMVAILAGFGVFNTNTLRLNISIALVAMVNESALIEASSSGSTAAFATAATTTHMCRIPESGGGMLTNLSAVQSMEHVDQDGPFAWDEATRGALLSAYFWGNVFGQIPGGILADRFGGKSSFGIGIFVSSLVTLLMPEAAFYDVKLVFALRVLCGFAQGMALPALYSLLVHWVPHDEKSRLTGLTYSGVSLGKVIVFPISGILCDSNLLGGWPSVFYVFGSIGIVWSLAWALLVHDDPSDDPKVSKQELMHIQENVSVKMTSTKKRKINWKRLARPGPLWALLLAYFSSSWGAQILLTMLPSYLKFAMGFDMKSSGMVNGLPHIVAVIVSLVASCCADMLANSKTFSPTNTRKLFVCIAMLGPMVCLLGVTFLECDRVGLVMLLTLSVSLAAVNSGGLFINEMDLSMKLAGTLKGMTNFASNLSGIIAPYAAGVLVRNNESLAEWNKVFYLSAAILFIGATAFLLFGSADDQDFCEYDDDEQSIIGSENNNYRSYGSTNQEVEKTVE